MVAFIPPLFNSSLHVDFDTWSRSNETWSIQSSDDSSSTETPALKPELYVVGVLISLAASLLDAIGINLQRRDHVTNAQLPLDQQRHECKRPTWHLGFAMYVISQLGGSTGALGN